MACLVSRCPVVVAAHQVADCSATFEGDNWRRPMVRLTHPCISCHTTAVEIAGGAKNHNCMPVLNWPYPECGQRQYIYHKSQITNHHNKDPIEPTKHTGQRQHLSERVVTNADLIKASKLHPICTALLKAYFKISLACPMFKAC